jgi:hypothetical protein
MALIDLIGWMDENTGKDIVWYVKRLSANDTLACGSHQAGPYIPKAFLFHVFPLLNHPEEENPYIWFDLYIDSHSQEKITAKAVWYNNSLRGGSRNEARLTNLGGQKSALLDSESTGSLAVFAFHKDTSVGTIFQIFIEENLRQDIDFQYQIESESGKKPDFLFPNGAAYKNENFSSDKLRMLAVKTTCKDRWRQILNEAARIPQKHLLTLQKGVSVNQFREMQEANVCLIVPEPLISYYPEAVRPHLQTLEDFIREVRLVNS